ncbi:hypothetical protein [Nocardioides limicola]|uniref:hypothetical protein n=1 Tax=Nocardioides limicola TaxID=2803368 RepID=UPI00193C678A|nr:hypothetical protein [Nocardioides sp. DJM-14]
MTAIAFGTLSTDVSTADVEATADFTPMSLGDITQERLEVVSRSAGRAVEEAQPGIREARREARDAATRRAIRNAEVQQWTTAALNLWTGRGDSAAQDGTLEAGKKVLLTGRTGNGRVEIVVKQTAYWVTEGYLSDDKPVVTSGAASAAPCANGASASGGANVQKVLRATCAFAPEIRSYGGIRGGGGDHGRGKALDIMVSGERGWQIANHLRANYRQLGITYIIYAQRIWSLDRSGEGWRPMSNRGSATANHYDHVHVSVF